MIPRNVRFRYSIIMVRERLEAESRRERWTALALRARRKIRNVRFGYCGRLKNCA